MNIAYELAVAVTPDTAMEEFIDAQSGNFKEIGSGSYGAAYGSNEIKWLCYKVVDFDNNLAYLNYICTAIRNQHNPIFPKIYGVRVVRSPNSEFAPKTLKGFMKKIPKIVKDIVVNDITPPKQDCTVLVAMERLQSCEGWDVMCEFIKSVIRADGNKNAIIQSAAPFTVFMTPGRRDEFISDWTQFSDEVKILKDHHTVDMHDENFMRRGNQVVVIDPFME